MGEDGSEDVVYLFSSGSRDIYREDVYNTLAVPPGFAIQFRYRKRWIGSDIKNGSPEDLEGATAIVVASPLSDENSHKKRGSSKDTNYDYFPLRKGQIIQAEYRGDALHVHCKMSSTLIDYQGDNQPATEILDLEEKPADNSSDDVFISKSGNLDIPVTGTSAEDRTLKFENTENKWNENEDAWVKIIDELGSHSLFEKTLFFRISETETLRESLFNSLVARIADIGGNGGLSKQKIFPRVQAIYEEARRGYVIDSSGQYKFDILLVYAEDTPDDAASQQLKIEGDQSLETSISELQLGFRTDTEVVTINPQSTRRHEFSQLSISSEEAGFTAPNLQLPIVLRQNYWKRGGIYIAVLVGLFFTTVPDALAAILYSLPWDWLTISRSAVQSLITGLGFVLVAFGLQLWSWE